MQHAITNLITAEHKHAAIPQMRPLPLHIGEEPVDLATPRGGKFPSPRLDHKFDAIDLDDFDIGPLQRHRRLAYGDDALIAAGMLN